MNKRKLTKNYALFLYFFMVGCSHIKSGKHIKVEIGDSWESLSQEFNVPAWFLKDTNIEKKLVPGEWVFIPLNWGILGHGVRSPASLLKGDEFIWPVPSSQKISSKFGRRWGKRHEGIDIPAKRGSFILAVGDGVVVYAGDQLGGYGNILVLGHAYGLFTVYAHVDKIYV